jgi:dTDP-4-dehydrorhamnose 3,5-epimerase
MKLAATAIPGCFVVTPDSHSDVRGGLTKTFAASHFADAGLTAPFREHFHSWSRHGVLRGLHVQAPPHDGAKLVVCAAGEVLDVVVDLRAGSPAFGRPLSHSLRGPGDALLVPAGVAHGFYVVSDECLVCYSTTAEYTTPSDDGVRWDSVGAPWPDRDPLVSQRDAGLRPLSEYESPFVYALAGVPA